MYPQGTDPQSAECSRYVSQLQGTSSHSNTFSGYSKQLPAMFDKIDQTQRNAHF